MRRLMAGSAALACALTVAAPALAKTKAPPIERELAITSLFAVTSASGTEQVDFRGDGATGCVDHGTCDTSGTIAYAFHLSGDDNFAAFLGRRRKIGFGVLSVDGQTTAKVQRGSSACNDSAISGGDTFLAIQHGSSLRVTLHGSLSQALGLSGPPQLTNLLTTRCGGPLDADVQAALPTLDVPLSALTKATVQLHLQGAAPFAVAGLAGTVTTDFQLTLRRVRLKR